MTTAQRKELCGHRNLLTLRRICIVRSYSMVSGVSLRLLSYLHYADTRPVGRPTCRWSDRNPPQRSRQTRNVQPHVWLRYFATAFLQTMRNFGLLEASDTVQLLYCKASRWNRSGTRCQSE